VYLTCLSCVENACAILYCHLWPVCNYRIFRHYLTNRTIFGERSLNMKVWFLLSQICLINLSF